MATVVNGYTLEPNVNLAGADLMYADLEYVDLSYSYMADVNLYGANLRYSNLTGANLNRANLDRSNIEYADLSSSFLFEASLNRASLFGTDLTYADLSGANLTGSNLTEVDLSHAQLNDVIMFSTDFGGVNLSGANLTDADLTSADMTEANLVGANLTDADLTSVDLTGADLTGAILTGVDLTDTDLTGADLTGADLTGVDLSSADLNQLRSSEIIGIPVLPTGYTLTDGYIIGPNIDLSNADIGEVDFSGANLKGANLYDTTLYGDMSGYNPALYGAKLSNTDFTGADLTYATLSYADLTNANLTNANLTQTNFTRADLTGANLTGAVLTGTSFLETNLTGADLSDTSITLVSWSWANLTGVDLSGASLTNLTLEYSDLTGADLTDTSLTLVNLTGADLTGVDLSSADLDRITSSEIIGIPILPTGYTLVEGFDWEGKEPSSYIVGPNVGISWGNLTGADLTGADLTGAGLIGTNFTGVNLSGANLTNASLQSTKFVNANLTDSNLTGANLRDVHLTGADLSGANLTLSNLERAKLDGADLTGANLTSAYLKDADLTIADLTGIISGSIAGTPILPASYNVVNGYIVGANVNLIDADLTGADLTDAVLTGADLSGADLSNANLTGADLTGADLTGTNVNGATGLEVLSQEQLDVTIVNNLPSGAVTIDGTASQGNDLTAVTTALADEDGLGTLSYQWTANGIDISSATDRILTLGQSEVGKEITVSVSYTDDGGTAETMSSAATSAVTNVNDAPTISTTTSLSTDEDTAIAAIAFSGADVDGDDLTFTFSDPAKGTVTNNDDGTFTYTPDANVNGSDSFTITVNDGTVDVTETVNVAIAAVNDAPTISTTTSLSTDEDTATGAIAFSGSDIDGDNLTYSFSSPSKGSAIDNGDNTFTYTPDNNANSSDSFTITVNDGTLDITETVAVIINPVNDVPTGNLIYHGKFVENQTLSADVTQINDHDGLGNFTYIWKKDGQVITGENTQYYTLKNDDVASIISAEVTFTDNFGTMETVLGEGISEISPLGDLRSLDFGFLETSGDTLENRISVQLSDSFSAANSISLLYWKEGEDQTWITLVRDNDTKYFTNNAEINRFSSDGDYAVRRIDATDDFGSNVQFTEEKMSELGFNTKFTLVNSKSDNIAPEVQSVFVSEFYYEQLSELWKLDYSLTASDNISGLQLGHIVELTSPTGSSLQEWRYFDENGEIETTLSFDKNIPSGDYTINTIRIHDDAGNKGWLYPNDLSNFGQEFSITLDNPFGDNDLPSLDSFMLTAEFNSETLRPSILFDFVASDQGSGFKNAYVRISDQNGLNNDRWINDADQQKSGIQFALDLTQEYTSGQFTINFFNVYDHVDNKLQINTNDFIDLNFENSINVFFKPVDADQSYVIKATDTNDWLIGSNSDDIFVAGDGDDFIYAGDGDDDVYAGTGDDLIIGGSGIGDDIYRGGEGVDTIKYTSALAGIIVDLTVGTASSIDENDPASIGSDTLFDVENVIAGDFDDIVKGSTANNILTGGSGNDTLSGGAGSDTFVFKGEFGQDTITDYNSDVDILEFYAADGTELNISDLIESANTDGNRVLSTSDGASSVTIENGGGNVLEDASVAITTTITDRFGNAMTSAEAQAYEDSVNEITATSTTGNVTVFETASGSDLLIDAAMAIDTASDKAIGAFDALQALRLAVGLDKSDGTSEWHDYIAADINKDGRVGADDALNILKFAVGLTDGPSADWVFVDGDADYSAIDRKNTDYDEGILISDVMTDLSINMTGILVGDVDGSYIA